MEDSKTRLINIKSNRERGMDKRERELYELALRVGKRRYGTLCKHEKVKNGYCVKCQRRVK